jgi:hypothetical protein
MLSTSTEDTSQVVPSAQQCFPSVQQTACKISNLPFLVSWSSCVHKLIRLISITIFSWTYLIGWFSTLDNYSVYICIDLNWFPETCWNHSFKSETCLNQSFKSEPSLNQSFKSETCLNQSFKSETCLNQSFKSETCWNHSFNSEPCLSQSFNSETWLWFEWLIQTGFWF